VVYKSCGHLIYNCMWFSGDLSKEDKPLMLTFCCRDESRNIGVLLCENPAETYANYIARKNEIINEAIRVKQTGEDSENDYFNACSRCDYFFEAESTDYDHVEGIHIITYGIDPAPCQAKCIYCWSEDNQRRPYNKETDDPGYELLFKHIEYFREQKLFSDSMHWDFGAGEISIHPFRERLFDAVGTDHGRWLTNCFIFSERIAENLKANPLSCVLFSMDAGTAKTWHKVKGVDNFSKVKENLLKYIHAAQNPSEQVHLKYIILPGINDDIKNFNAFIQFALANNIKVITLSRDATKACTDADIERASLLASFIFKNGLNPGFDIFTPEEMEKIVEMAATNFARYHPDYKIQ